MLYLVATPIGNLSDISKRAIETLTNCDYIASEDTRHTLRLLNALDIKKKLVSYHQHNMESSGLSILNDVIAGMNVCLVTDAGCPAISDPGNELVKLMYQYNQKVTVIPGANAAISALMISPFDTSSFCFEGFPPVKSSLKKEFFEKIRDESRTCIIYEAPHKLVKTINLAKQIVGGERRISLVKEITKIYETVVVDSLDGISKYLEQNEPKGEYVIIFEGSSKTVQEHENIEPDNREQDILSLYEELIKNGFPRKDAMRKIAVKYNISRNEVYSVLFGRSRG
ncbi:MAG TPA: 16S rRNA (cytidine(1402)-2'-O)-methyltransferase [Clostridia bacterium]|nr:MAG: Ribosomal RNA small subunit methyltransferase I [Firmicutes bacterium ADurb.Bin146]HOD93399.1 16S rRNA (cytidine(1402)-2'-O)-methyltransferase [Clostridia bacterium]HQM38897.1 16S rRNA (cytidine(1402)-2'-O)-methyltransferase [Clostridia bacterium]